MRLDGLIVPLLLMMCCLAGARNVGGGRGL